MKKINPPAELHLKPHDIVKVWDDATLYSRVSGLDAEVVRSYGAAKDLAIKFDDHSPYVKITPDAYHEVGYFRFLMDGEEREDWLYNYWVIPADPDLPACCLYIWKAE